MGFRAGKISKGGADISPTFSIFRQKIHFRAGAYP